MRRYAVFGLELVCDFELPELTGLPPAAAAAWRVHTCRTDPPRGNYTPVGEDTVYGSVRVRAFSSVGCFRLVFDDTGTFDVRQSDRTIAWYPGRDARDAAVRADLLGRVAALAVHADGGLALHASAVSIDGRAVAFLGPKHAGKSTLALALVRRGARLITDDTLAVRCEANAARVTPGVQRARLWEDSARVLELLRTAVHQASEKPVIDALAPDQLESGVVPLDACYALQPAAAVPGGVSVIRARQPAVQATMTGVRFAKLGTLLGGGEGPVVLDRAARLAGASAFYSATVLRDLSRLDDVAAQLIDWHARGAVSSAGRRA